MGERLIFTFAPTGRREWGGMEPRAPAWALDLLGFQPVQGRRQGFFFAQSPPTSYLKFASFGTPLDFLKPEKE